MRKNPNQPIVPITLKKDIAVPRFMVSDARLGRANKSGRRSASYGDMVGLDYSKESLESKAAATVIASVQSVAADKYKKDEKDKQDLITLNQIQESLQEDIDEFDKRLAAIKKQLDLPVMAQLTEDILINPETAQYGDRLNEILQAVKSGDYDLAQSLSEKLGEVIGKEEKEETPEEEPPVDSTAVPPSIEPSYEEKLEQGLIYTDGLSTEYGYESAIPFSGAEDIVAPSRVTAPSFNPDAILEVIGEISAETYKEMSNKERLEWRENSYDNKIEYYHPDKGWLGYQRPGWTKARWRGR